MSRDVCDGQGELAEYLIESTRKRIVFSGNTHRSTVDLTLAPFVETIIIEGTGCQGILSSNTTKIENSTGVYTCYVSS